MKATKYTREQLVRAIDYWTRKLDFLKESTTTNDVIDALIDEFGEDTVKSTKLDFIPTEDSMIKIFNILNRTFFKNKLPKIKIRYCPDNEIVDILNDNLEKSGVFDSYHSYDKDIVCGGIYSAACAEIKDHNENIVDLKFFNDVIVISSSYLKRCIFIFAVAVMCHEMIHFAERCQPWFSELKLKEELTGKKAILILVIFL